jgi:DNA invertase Pin-like site-specific DNA recombinase
VEAVIGSIIIVAGNDALDSSVRAAWKAELDGVFAFNHCHRRLQTKSGPLTREQFAQARQRLGQNTPLASVARALQLSRQTLYRIKTNPVGCEAALVAWGL